MNRDAVVVAGYKTGEICSCHGALNILCYRPASVGWMFDMLLMLRQMQTDENLAQSRRTLQSLPGLTVSKMAGQQQPYLNCMFHVLYKHLRLATCGRAKHGLWAECNALLLVDAVVNAPCPIT